VSFLQTVVLGAIAGFTIYLGLPIARLQRVDDRVRVALAMFSVGVLAFVFMDVSKHGQAIVETTLASYKVHQASFAHVLGLFALLAVGFSVGTGGIPTLQRRLRLRGSIRPPVAGGESTATFTPNELVSHEAALIAARSRALQTGMTIAIAIGLHNFAEGLAIGVSARAGALSLATVLVIGFALHNATEGFGIAGPLGDVKPSWRWLGLVGLVGGGPTFVGSMVGYQVHSAALQLCFYAVAGGAVIYVIGEIWHGVRRFGRRELGLYALAVGFLVGVATDLVVAYGGG